MARVRVKRSNSNLAVAIAHRALQQAQILVETAQHFQHGFAIVEEDVAPHGGIGRGDAGEIAKAAGGEFDHFGLR